MNEAAKITDRTIILAIGNNKGGVGKSFLTKTLGEFSACRLGLKTLLIDLDPQTNLSKRFLKMQRIPGAVEDYVPPRHPDWDASETEWDGRSSSAAIWKGGVIIPYPTDFPNLDVLPGHAAMLEEIERVHVHEVYSKVVDRLYDFLRHPSIQSGYDVILVDTRPSKGPLTTAGVMGATHLVIPTEMEAPSVEGLYGMLSLRTQINLRRPRNDQVKMLGILPNKLQINTVLHREFLAMLNSDPEVKQLILPVTLGYRSDFKKSMLSAQDSLFLKPASMKARMEAEQVCETLFGMMYGDYYANIDRQRAPSTTVAPVATVATDDEEALA